MRVMAGCVAVTMLLLAPYGASTAAAQNVGTNDIQRLQEAVNDVDRDVSRLRSRDAQLAGDLQTQLDELRDEVIYLRVKLRKEGSVSRADYNDVRDRLDDVRGRAGGSDTFTRRDQGSAGDGSYTPERPRSGIGRTTGTSGSSVIPVGQELDVRLQDTLSSDRNQVEDRFLATTLVDLEIDGRVVIPAGSELRGVVSSVNPAGRIDRKGSMTVTFDQLTVRERSYPIRGTVTEALESSGVRGEAGKIGTGAGVGAIIGGILGGFKGALAGILIGGGGVIAATEGKDVELPAGTVLRVRLDAPPALR
jgi:hypothetical protein